ARNRANTSASRFSNDSDGVPGSRRGTKALVPKKHVLLRCFTPGFLRADQVFDVHISTYSTDPRQLQVRRIKAYLRQNVMYKHEKEPILYSTVIAHDKLKPKASILFPQPAENEFKMTINPAKTRWRDEFLNFTGEATKSSIPVATGIVSDKLNRTLLSVDYTIEIHVSILGGTKIAKSVPVVLESPSVGMVLSSENRVAVQDLPDEAVREPELVEEMDSSDEELTDEELDDDEYERLQKEAFGQPQCNSPANKSKSASHHKLNASKGDSSMRSRALSSPPVSPHYDGRSGSGDTAVRRDSLPVSPSLEDSQGNGTGTEQDAHTTHTTTLVRMQSSSPGTSQTIAHRQNSIQTGSQLVSEAQRVPLPAVSVGAIVPPSYENLNETSTPAINTMSVRSRSEQLAAKFTRTKKREKEKEKEKKKGGLNAGGASSGSGHSGDVPASQTSTNPPGKHVKFMKKLRARATTRNQTSSSSSPTVQRNASMARTRSSGLPRSQLSVTNENGDVEGVDEHGLPRYSMISTAAALLNTEDSRNSTREL
ncbi:hypothetical protein SARC_04052, partial [Sphaeroforma arctica JP610]